MAETDLETFVEEALGQIVRGVSKAQSAAAEEGAAINPSLDTFNKETTAGRTADNRNAYIASFDLAVTVSSESTTEGQGGLKVLGLKADGSAKGSDATQSVSRISFTVPIAFPEEEKTAEDLRENKLRASRARRQVSGLV